MIVIVKVSGMELSLLIVVGLERIASVLTDVQDVSITWTKFLVELSERLVLRAIGSVKKLRKGFMLLFK